MDLHDVDSLFRARGQAVNAARAAGPLGDAPLCPVCGSLLLPGETVETCAGCRIGRVLTDLYGPPPPPVDVADVARRAADVLDSWGHPDGAELMRRRADEL